MANFRSCVNAARAAWVASKQKADALLETWEIAYDAWEDAGMPSTGPVFEAKEAATIALNKAEKAESIAKQAWHDGAALV